MVGVLRAFRLVDTPDSLLQSDLIVFTVWLLASAAAVNYAFTALLLTYAAWSSLDIPTESSPVKRHGPFIPCSHRTSSLGSFHGLTTHAPDPMRRFLSDQFVEKSLHLDDAPSEVEAIINSFSSFGGHARRRLDAEEKQTPPDVMYDSIQNRLRQLAAQQEINWMAKFVWLKERFHNASFKSVQQGRQDAAWIAEAVDELLASAYVAPPSDCPATSFSFPADHHRSEPVYRCLDANGRVLPFRGQLLEFVISVSTVTDVPSSANSSGP